MPLKYIRELKNCQLHESVSARPSVKSTYAIHLYARISKSTSLYGQVLVVIFQIHAIFEGGYTKGRLDRCKDVSVLPLRVFPNHAKEL